MRIALTRALLLTTCCPAGTNADDRGSYAKWSKIELSFAGPESKGSGAANPFAVRFDVQFASPTGVKFQVPSFYDGNGQGGLDGNVWKELGDTRAFMETLPFWEMQPRNDLVTAGQAFCLADPDHVYAFYLPEGGPIQVKLKEGVDYDVAWWNPGNGKDDSFSEKPTCRGGLQRFEAPSDGDWAMRILKRD